MSAADRMAVRMPGGEIRSVPRRVGLAMVARSQATHAPAQSAPNPAAKGRRPAQTSGIVDLADPRHGPVVSPVEFEEDEPVHVLSQTPGQIAETMRTGELPGGPAHSPVEDDDPTAQPASVAFAVAPKGNASRDAWAKYAGFRGVPVTDEMGRNEIRAAVAELALDRMSRPALQGGRPATPEDEPVTEDMVTSDDPGERTT